MKKTHEDLWGTGEDFIGFKAIGTNTDESFKTLEEVLMVEKGSNSNSEWRIYSDGTVELVASIDYDRTAGEFLYNLPIAVENILDVNIFSRSTAFASVQDSQVLGVGISGATQVRIMRHTNLTMRETSGLIPLKLFIKAQQ